jgi:undecaprenyl-diphosphatase
MRFELLFDLAKLAFFVAAAYLLLQASVRRWRPGWSPRLAGRRLAVLGLLTLAMGAVKVFEDVVAHESGPVDTAILWFIHEKVPAAWHGFFTAVTLSGSAGFLLPASAIAVAVLLITRRRFEALLLGSSMLAGTLLIFVLKTLVGRVRPALWSTDRYWGSSFPSGHALGTAVFATAFALCIARLCPRATSTAMAAAMLWAGLVAISRLVLGVHWPSDVLAALCMGVFIPLAFSVWFDQGAAVPG